METTVLVVIAAYLVGVTVVGSVLARRSAGGSGWAVADGRMGLLLVAVGVAGTRIGGVGTYGVAGDVVNRGLWSFWYAVNTLLALALVGCFFAVPFRRLQVRTVAEVFLRRFGSRRCQVLTCRVCASTSPCT